MVWKADNPQGNEAAKIKYEIVEYTRGIVLDLGCGPWKAYPHFISVDTHQEWQGLEWQPDITADATDLSMFSSQSMDAVFSSHLLEHVENAAKALKEWWRVIKHGGCLVLYLPHKNLYPNIGTEGSNPDHRHDFIPGDIMKLMSALGGWDLLRSEERDDNDEYSFFQVYRKRSDKKQIHVWSQEEKPKKSCAVVRYGGFGDMIQASSILPGLKRQGYHITFYTTPRGHEVLKADPHVDVFFIQDTDQVPNHELTAFWKVQAEKYDKFINLSESVEGAFLAMPGRTKYYWPRDARHEICDVNYLEFTHKLAGVPMPPEQRFYPTPKETTWADKQRRAIHGRVFLWCLAGSSVHKTWPYLDEVIAKCMLTYDDVFFVLVGDGLCKLLEAGWEAEPRVIGKSGEWSIRQTLAFARTVDMVIGPETGILNAVGQLDIPKIIYLSHSSPENITKHWNNCIPLVPSDCPCYPCHVMHFGFDNCVRDSFTGVAKCQANISADAMFEAIRVHLRSIEKRAA